MFKALKSDNSPFTELQIQQLQASLGSLNVAQSAWLSGYIAGRLASQTDPLPLADALPQFDSQLKSGAAAEPASAVKPLQVFFASQTGNGEEIARELGREAQRAGLKVDVQSLSTLRPVALKKLEYAAFVISTHGEGDPPDDALDLIEYLESPRAGRLENLQFRVLALGDRSYSQFCAAGRKLEALLLAQGATVFAERVECDVDYQEAANAWSAEVVRFGQEQLAPDTSSTAINAAPARLSIVPQTVRWNRANPYAATVERVQKITGTGSEKDVYHLELSLADSGLEYQPGDALGVWAHNRHELVEEVLAGLRIDSAEEIELDGQRHSAHELLARHRELTRLSNDTIESYSVLAGNTDLQQHFGQLDETRRREFIESRQFADLVSEFPVQGGARIGLEELAHILRPLASRSYSIASSQAVVEEEVHLTVATLFSEVNGTQRRGIASDFLNYHVQPGDEVGVFIEPNRRFRLPENRDTPLILIGAGTGVAPYRGFLQQLESEGQAPDTWLIFGNPHLRTDFLYQKEWLEWRSRGLIKHIDGAFSRDQAQKHYVQHIVREQAVRIGQWLDNQARIYICGGLAMGREVEDALRDVLAERDGSNLEQANEALAALRRQGRLLKDLY